VAVSLTKNRWLSFWPLQISGWLLYTLLNVVSSIPNRHQPDYLAFRGAFLFSGFLASFLMYAVSHILWKRHTNLLHAAIACTLVAYPLGFLCAASAFWAGIYFAPRARPPFQWGAVLSATPSGVFVLIAWASFYFGIKHYHALKEKQRQLMETETMARDAQLRALRYQLQPHFLFNTLNAISTLVLDNKPQIAVAMISKLASLLRSTLDAPDVHHVSLAEELALTEEYLAIEEVRFGPRLTVRLDIDSSMLNTRVPRLILQPLVENAVRHGIAHRIDGGCIAIRARASGPNLAVSIENEPSQGSVSVLLDGVVRPGGVGLTNVRKRLEQMYGAEGKLYVTTNARGNYEVSLSFPSIPMTGSGVYAPAQHLMSWDEP